MLIAQVNLVLIGQDTTHANVLSFVVRGVGLAFDLYAAGQTHECLYGRQESNASEDYIHFL